MLKMSVQFQLRTFTARWVSMSPTPLFGGGKWENHFLFPSFPFARGFKAVEMLEMIFVRNVQGFSAVLILQGLHVDMGSNTLKEQAFQYKIRCLIAPSNIIGAGSGIEFRFKGSYSTFPQAGSSQLAKIIFRHISNYKNFPFLGLLKRSCSHPMFQIQEMHTPLDMATIKEHISQVSAFLMGSSILMLQQPTHVKCLSNSIIANSKKLRLLARHLS